MLILINKHYKNKNKNTTIITKTTDMFYFKSYSLPKNGLTSSP